MSLLVDINYQTAPHSWGNLRTLTVRQFFSFISMHPTGDNTLLRVVRVIYGRCSVRLTLNSHLNVGLCKKHLLLLSFMCAVFISLWFPTAPEGSNWRKLVGRSTYRLPLTTELALLLCVFCVWCWAGSKGDWKYYRISMLNWLHLLSLLKITTVSL